MWEYFNPLTEIEIRVHVLVRPLASHRLVDILHSWKSFTANLLNRRLGRTGRLWQHESYDHIVRNEAAKQTIRRYIRENPKGATVTNVAGAGSSRPRTSDLEQDASAT